MAPELVFTIVSVVLVLAFGLFGGLWSVKWSPQTVQSFHVALGAGLLVLIAVGVWLQYRRVQRFGKVDYVSAAHLALFAVLAFSAARALRRWGQTPRRLQGGDQPGNYMVTYKGKPYNLEPFLNQHPGGRKILEDALNKPGRPSDVESLWKDNHVSWHQHNSRVQEIWKTL